MVRAGRTANSLPTLDQMGSRNAGGEGAGLRTWSPAVVRGHHRRGAGRGHRATPGQWVGYTLTIQLAERLRAERSDSQSVVPCRRTFELGDLLPRPVQFASRNVGGEVRVERLDELVHPQSRSCNAAQDL